MLDVRTHGKIFRPFVAQEQRWLMKFRNLKTCGNCHIFRSLASGGAEGRSQSKIQKIEMKRSGEDARLAAQDVVVPEKILAMDY